MPEPRGALATAVESFIERLKIQQRFENTVTDIAERSRKRARNAVSTGLRKSGIPISAQNEIDRIFDGFAEDNIFISLLVAILAVVSVIPTVVGGVGGVLGKALANIMEAEFRTQRPDPSTAIAFARRNPKLAQQMETYLIEAGWPQDIIDSAPNVLIETLPGLPLMQAVRRGIISHEAMVTELLAQGMRKSDIDTLFGLSEFIPPVQDIIHFAVRDVFNPAAVQRFSLDEDFPTGILGLAKKLGISEETLRWYWAAHWTLPSPGQALEMFQRLREGRTQHTFKSDDLDRYMITADIPAFFRERFKEIAYSPLTRVDVRRMYGVGVLDRRGVLDAYMDAGYSKTNAELLTEFTIRFEGSDQIAITRGAILKSYKEGLSTRPEAVQLLEQTGHDQLAIQFWLELADHEDAVKEREEELDIIKVGFIEGVIRRDELAGQLGQLEVTGREQEILLAQWERLKRARIALPSVGELENWYKRSVVTATEYVDSMREKGFLERDINRFIRAMDDEVEDANRKELERAQKEQERLDTAQRRNEFQVELARLDVRIAELRLSIANAKIAIHASEDPDEVEELKTLILEHQASIVRLQIDKAKVRTSPP